MKKLVYVAFVTLLTAGMIHYIPKREKPLTEDEIKQIEQIFDTTETVTRQDTLFAMANAFAHVESKFNEKEVSSCGRWVGCLQLSTIMVREANQILGEQRFSYEDRLDKHKSFEIFCVIQEHHNPTLDIGKAITIWNRGCPPSYRRDVKSYYQNNLGNIKSMKNFFMVENQ